LIGGFVVGFIVTIAEPDLSVLAEKVAALPNWTLIATVAVGVGVSLALALWRIVRAIPLRWLLIACYAVVVVLSIFVTDDFVPAAFDSGGVTTGAMTVPFILSLGMGVASVRSDSESASDSFGLVALSSVGPILVMLLLGLILKPGSGAYEPVIIPELMDSTALFQQFVAGSVTYFKDVGASLLPLIIVYALFQLMNRGGWPDRHELAQICVGIVYAYFGLVVFLTGVNVGFMPAGAYLGERIASMSARWILIPLGMLIGYFIVATEPAVHVLIRQVEEMTEGAVAAGSIRTSLGIGVGISVALAMVRVLTGLSLYWLILPGYAIALGLSFFTPKLFTAIAFDSGGVASGPLTTAFLLPFAIGACQAVGGNVAQNAFGLVALVAMTPLITIQIMGVIYSRKPREYAAVGTTKEIAAEEMLADEIIELDLPENVASLLWEGDCDPPPNLPLGIGTKERVASLLWEGDCDPPPNLPQGIGTKERVDSLLWEGDCDPPLGLPQGVGTKERVDSLLWEGDCDPPLGIGTKERGTMEHDLLPPLPPRGEVEAAANEKQPLDIV
jgi:hypothetical protein